MSNKALTQLPAALISEVEKSKEAFVLIDYHFRFLYVNAVAEKYFKKKKSELIGRTAKEIFPNQWDFGPFKTSRRYVAARKRFELVYQSPFTESWVKLVGEPHGDYYLYSYHPVDYQTHLRDELRNELKKKS